MPETPDIGPPGRQPQPQTAPDQDPDVTSSARPPRPPLWRRPRVLIPCIAAVAVAVAAAVLGPGTLTRQHATLPPPCTLVTARTLARYLPGARGVPLGAPVPDGCRWLSSSGPQGEPELVVAAALFDSSSGASLARQDFNADAHSTISGSGITTTRQSVTGLGDQAVAEMAQFGKDVIPQTPIVVVYVRSRDTVVTVVLTIDSAQLEPAPPTGAELLSETIAIARDVLAVLADHGSI